MLADAGSIPAISTNNKGHRFSVAFFIGGSGVDENPRTGFEKIARSTINVRFMHGPEGVSPMDGTNNPASFKSQTIINRRAKFV
ncbi:MAG: hypothetical protein ACNYZG_00250 [Gammaproteobacteria bacterium]